MPTKVDTTRYCDRVMLQLLCKILFIAYQASYSLYFRFEKVIHFFESRNSVSAVFNCSFISCISMILCSILYFRIFYFEDMLLTGQGISYKYSIVVAGRSVVTGVRLSQLSRLSDIHSSIDSFYSISVRIVLFIVASHRFLTRRRAWYGTHP